MVGGGRRILLLSRGADWAIRPAFPLFPNQSRRSWNGKAIRPGPSSEGIAARRISAGTMQGKATMVKRFLDPILADEALTRGLRDPEARMLVEWLVEQAERLAETARPEEAADQEVARLCRRGRAISRFVGLWCHGGSRGAALQLACTERFAWPLPTSFIDPCELMQSIIDWEAKTHPL